MQPGQTINPGDQTDRPTEQPVATAVAATPSPPPVPEPTPLPVNSSEPEPMEWSAAADEPTSPLPSNAPAVTWTASEFIDHEKRATWFLGLVGATVVASALIYLITQDFFATAVIAIAAALFGVTAGRHPSTLTYVLDQNGIQIGPKHYEYAKFKSFSVIEEGAIDSILLTPLTRFAPPISLYYPPEQEDQIVGTLANYLPHEDRRHDPVDRLMKRIRF